MWRIDWKRADGITRVDNFLYNDRKTAEEHLRVAWAVEENFRKKGIYGYVEETPVLVECEETVY